MYLIKVYKQKSDIEGFGVFASGKIIKGEIVWKYDPAYDKSLTKEEFDKLEQEEKNIIEKIGYLSVASNKWIYPPGDDMARFTNHSNSNNLTVVLDKNISEEPYFIANRDMIKGEELSVNYKEFDKFIHDIKPNWVN